VKNQPELDQTLALTTTLMMPTKPTDFPHPHQPDSLPTPPQPSNLPPAAVKHKPSDLAALQCQLLCMQQEAKWLYPLLVLELMQQHFPQPMVPLPTAPPTHDNTLPAPAHLNPTPVPPTTHTTHSTQPALSMTERMTINTTHDNNSLWLPKALHRRHTLHRTIKTSQLAARLPACQLSPFPLLTTAIPSAINTPTDNHVHTVPFPVPNDIPCPVNNPLEDQCVTTQYTPAFNIHLHWPVNRQQYPLTSQRLLLVTTVKAFAHNRRPP